MNNSEIHIMLGAALALIVVVSFFRFRAQRAVLNRQSLMPFVSSVGIFSVMALFLFEGLIRLMLLAAIVGIYAPVFFWIVRSPRNDHSS